MQREPMGFSGNHDSGCESRAHGCPAHPDNMSETLLYLLYMATGHNARARRWAPIVGLCGQPFWLVFAVQSSAWGLLALSLAYSAVYVRGAWVQWRQP